MKSKQQNPPLPPSTSSISRYATPVPDWAPMSTPAWNPSSRTPTHGDTTSQSSLGALPESSAASSQQNIQHQLFDHRLVGIKLKVIIKNKQHKQSKVIAFLRLLQGSYSLQWPHYTSTQCLNPESVLITAKHPNPTRGNGLLVVVEGEHCGKYVRRIHHRYDNDVAIISLAIVAKNPDGGAADRLTGEQLELTRSFLCVGKESPEEREKGDALMEQIRKQARVHRAK